MIERIAVDRLSKAYAAESVFKSVSFSLQCGHALALTGPPGSGKTTLLRLLAGVLQPDSGAIDRRGRLGGIYSPEGTLLPAYTGRQNIRLVCAAMGLAKRQTKALTDDVLRLAGLGAAIDRPVKTFSLQERAQLTQALALCVPADIVLLDHMPHLWTAQWQARKQQGAALIFVPPSRKSLALADYMLCVKTEKLFRRADSH
ncbi:MAG: ATP-binding cassette domain-containing protein [Clostridia bacterium]|nr:ATP-binding cassette domain-containing protein [Clostridia bacterium]